MSRPQASEALVMRLMSASIAATALLTVPRATISPRIAVDIRTRNIKDIVQEEHFEIAVSATDRVVR
jgi:hypothetical protein